MSSLAPVRSNQGRVILETPPVWQMANRNQSILLTWRSVRLGHPRTQHRQVPNLELASQYVSSLSTARRTISARYGFCSPIYPPDCARCDWLQRGQHADFDLVFSVATHGFFVDS